MGSFRFVHVIGQNVIAALLILNSGCVKHETKSANAPMWANSLNMFFSPVPLVSLESPNALEAPQLLFSIYEVSEAQMGAFYKAFGKRAKWQLSASKAACHVSWMDAVAFCSWLTQKERASGLLRREQRYRLPSDHEWSCAVGIGHLETIKQGPEFKSRIKCCTYPWGQTWPPTIGAGNLAGLESRRHFPENHIAGFRDRYCHDAVGLGVSLPNRFGLYDLSGNLWEWCEDRFRPNHDWRVLRGGSWMTARAETLQSSHRTHDPKNYRSNSVGFRIVLEGKEVVN